MLKSTLLALVGAASAQTFVMDASCNSSVEQIHNEIMNLSNQLPTGEMYQTQYMFSDITTKCQKTSSGSGATLVCPAGAVETLQGEFKYVGEMLGRSTSSAAAQISKDVDNYWATFLGCAQAQALINLR